MNGMVRCRVGLTYTHTEAQALALHNSTEARSLWPSRTGTHTEVGDNNSGSSLQAL